MPASTMWPCVRPGLRVEFPSLHRRNIVALYGAEASPTRIARLYDVSHNVIYRVLREERVVLRGISWQPTRHSRNTPKRCARCKETKPPDAFRFRPGTAQLEAYCRPCDSTYNAEKRSKNREARLAACRKWHQENKDRQRATNKRWVKANPERVRASWRRARARRRNAEGEFTEADTSRLLVEQRGTCNGCGGDIRETWTVDHIMPLSRGGSNWPDNIQLLCALCNSKKGNRTMEEWTDAA
jgi:5-methylcytosine-specific restriction endonuclease McrA